MKRQIILFILTISLLGVLAACSSKKTEQESIVDFTHSSEKIEVFIAGESEPLEIITANEGLKELFDDLQYETWEVSEIPASSIQGTIYKMYDRKTAKLGESIEDKELYESGEIIVYSNEPYITFKTKLFTFSFKVPIEVQQKLLK